MKNFKSYLEEGRDAPLYHGTDIGRANKILQDNTLKASKSEYQYGERIASISLTRVIKHAFWFVKQTSISKENIIFELDQRLLTQNYKIIPIYDAKSSGNKGSPMYKEDRIVSKLKTNNEFEERVYTDIKNVDKYIKRIHIFGSSEEMIEKYYPAFKNYKGRILFRKNINV